MGGLIALPRHCRGIRAPSGVHALDWASPNPPTSQPSKPLCKRFGPLPLHPLRTSSMAQRPPNQRVPRWNPRGGITRPRRSGVDAASWKGQIIVQKGPGGHPIILPPPASPPEPLKWRLAENWCLSEVPRKHTNCVKRWHLQQSKLRKMGCTKAQKKITKNPLKGRGRSHFQGLGVT